MDYKEWTDGVTGRRGGKSHALDSKMYAFAESDRKLHHPILFECNSFRITNAIFNPPATIVYWEDGTKTVVKAIDEKFDPEKGLAMAFTKKALGNQGNYYNQLKKWIPSKNEDNQLCAKQWHNESDNILGHAVLENRQKL